MKKITKKLRVNKETIRLLTNEHLNKAWAGAEATIFSWVDTCAKQCTEVDCEYSYRNCPNPTQSCECNNFPSQTCP